MNFEQAVRTALEYERRVTDVYLDAIDKVGSAVGRKVFTTLAEEEKNHVKFLEKKLQEYREQGKVNLEVLRTVIPSREVLGREVSKLKKALEIRPAEQEVELLKKALRSEIETSDFYRKVASELTAEEAEFFQRFQVIEDGHTAIVQAEIDSVTGLGFWFDFQEFNLEG